MLAEEFNARLFMLTLTKPVFYGARVTVAELYSGVGRSIAVQKFRAWEDSYIQFQLDMSEYNRKVDLLIGEFGERLRELMGLPTTIAYTEFYKLLINYLFDDQIGFTTIEHFAVRVIELWRPNNANGT
jgi:hypothetical protein